jgi:RNA polymerase sigma-70 factor (ECF subfamily)
MTNGHPMDDDLQLLDRCVAGDRDAFNELVLKHQKPLYSMLYRMVSDADDAADILQKTFVKAFTGIKGFERRSSFRTWLYQIAINLAKNLYRDRARAGRVSLDDVIIRGDPKTLESLIKKETRDRLYKALTLLPDKQRFTVMLRIQEQRTFEEIAGIMKCSVGTSKANYHHGVQKLKILFEEAGAGSQAPGDENDMQK